MNMEKQMTKKKNELTETGSNEVAEYENTDAWGEEEVTHNDVIIPKILAMQGLSELVTDGKAMFGEFRNSVTGDLLAKNGESIEFIPVKRDKVWIEFTYDEKNDQYKFSGITPINRHNEDAPLEYRNDEGILCRRDRTFNFYVLLTRDLEQNVVQPYVLSFRRTSLRAGKVLGTQMFITNKNASRIPAAVAMKLSGKKEQNDKGTFIKLIVETSRDATGPEMKSAFSILQLIQSGETRVDDSDIGGVAKDVQNTDISKEKTEF